MSSSTATANTAITFLSNEASQALEEAKRLRAKLDTLAQNDPNRPGLERQIEELVQRSLRYSTIVTSTASRS